ncbi:MAG: biotin/lipoyl-binding protein [Clostridiales bacterium]|nr:biotin/lipoyl-binding protein [Clostridiales bacterium]
MSNYKVTVNGRSYEIEVEPMNGSAKTEAPAKSETKAAVTPVASAKAAPSSAPAAASANGGVNAPMPGTILKVNKAAGDSVEAGEAVVVLEAMKMENDINSPKAGVIKSIAVAQGDTVAAGQFLFEVE